MHTAEPLVRRHLRVTAHSPMLDLLQDRDLEAPSLELPWKLPPTHIWCHLVRVWRVSSMRKPSFVCGLCHIGPAQLCKDPPSLLQGPLQIPQTHQQAKTWVPVSGTLKCLSSSPKFILILSYPLMILQISACFQILGENLNLSQVSLF
jgi:hypothetical protein